MNQFNQGDRVRMTALGLEVGLRPRSVQTDDIFGVVSRQPQRGGTTVAVLIDGMKTIHTYHTDFWERAAMAQSAGRDVGRGGAT